MANLFNEHPTLTPAQSIISTLLYSPWKKLKKNIHSKVNIPLTVKRWVKIVNIT